jgi:predicted metalloprotease
MRQVRARPVGRRSVLGRAVSALAAVGLLLTGCSASVVGNASPGSDQPVDVAAAQFPITGAVDGAVDRLVRNSLADINDFWDEAFPKAYGKSFPPLSGGYFSVDSRNIDASAYPATGIGCAHQPVDPEETKDNAFYNPDCDAVAYDRALLSELSNDYGSALPPIVLAHEFGHAIQGRVGFAANGRSIQDETQADCFAGAWTAWVVGGHAKHVAIRAPQLDNVLRGYLTLSDPLGSDPDNSQAHGSFFDRVAAFSDGYDHGVTNCRDAFGADRVFTAATFASQQDYADQGNAPYDQTIDIIGKTLPPFWTGLFPSAFGKSFDQPTITSFDGSAPSCLAGGGSDRDVGYCAKNKTVYYDEKDLTRPAYAKIGDWAVATAISLPYSMAVRSELGRSTDGAAATRSAVCLTGWYTAQVYNQKYAGIALSPGDVDEAVEFLLVYGVQDTVFPNTKASGFELLRAFRDGFIRGGTSCDIGL